jgi:mannose-6-phosphate isomerase
MDEFVLLPAGYTEERPWGAFIVLEDTPEHKVKRLILHPGKRISYQRHTKRTEHWVIISGVADITLDDATSRHVPGDTILIVQGSKHRLANPGDEPLTVIEVQRGTYFGEDDIERFDDDFGRK